MTTETPRGVDDPATTDEAEESLWWLAAPPLTWLAHLLATYLTAANFCAKASEHAELTEVRWAIAAYSAAALIALGALGRRGWVRHRIGDATAPHDFDSRADRHRFLGFTLALLSGVAILGVLFASMPALFLETCR